MFKREKFVIMLFLVTLLPLTTVVSAPFLGPVTPMTNQAVSTRALATFIENFTTTTYQDSGATTAVGWGDGVLSSPRLGSITLLDHYTTSTPVRALEVQGRKAYLGIWRSTSGIALRILNITDPSDMEEMGSRSAPLHCFDLQIEGDLLFAGADSYLGAIDGQGDTWIYNVSDPYSITTYTDDFIGMEGLPTGMDVQGRFYYLTSYDASLSHGLYIFDVENPGTIHHIPNSMIFSELLDIDVAGQLAYLADGTYGLFIVNVSSPYTVTTLGSVDTPGNASGVLIDGSHAYVADGGSGVHIVDVSDPTSPVILGSYNTPGNAYRLALQGDTLYVADGTGGLIVLDVSDPTNACLIDSYALSYAWDVALYGGVVLVGSGNGVYSFRIGSMDSLSYMGSYSGGYEFWDVKVQGDVAYVAAGADGLLTIDVSDPVNPVLLDSYAVSAHFYRKVDVQGNRAYIADYGGGFLVFDISDPSNIEYLFYDGLSYATDVAAYGDVVFVADGTYGVYTYNVSSALAFGLIDTYDLGTENVTALWVQGYHLYVASEDSMNEPFAVFDIRDTHDITKIYSWTPYVATFYDVYVDGDFAYTPDALGFVAAWNVTDPYNTYYTDFTTSFGLDVPSGVWGFGPYLVAANYSAGVALYDVSDVDNIQYLDCYAGATTAIQLTVHGDYVYVANRNSLVILRLFRSRGATYQTGTYTAQSLNLQPSTFYYVTATLNANDDVPASTSVNYFLSADGGLHWEAVTPGTLHTFTYIGLDLRWKTNFTSAYSDRTVRIYEISVAYEVGPPAANPLPVIIAAVVIIIVVILIILLLYLFWFRKKGK
ncbi:MAG: hypothetical protein ACFFCO_04585 [Promethearchaeota archaeon]